MIDRRRFVSLASGLSVALAIRPSLAAGTGSPHWGRVLVLVELKGGNDGLNTVVPHADPEYRRLRPTLAIERERVLALTPELALHPGLRPLLDSWNAGDLGVVLGVGYPDPDRSHFRSLEIWDTGSASEENLDDGWIARAMRDAPRPAGFAIDSVVVDENALPVSGAGFRNIVLRDVETFIHQAERLQGPAVERMANPALRHLLKVRAETHRAAFSLRERMRNAPAPAIEMPDTPFGRQLDLALRLLMSRTPLAAIKVGLGGFDTHARQRETHDRLLAILGGGLASFRTALRQAGLWDDVLVLTYSEFGRRVAENDSQGTDHGTAAPQFAMGGRVRGGLHGRQPSLGDLSDGDLRHAVDFRDVFATVSRRWWGLDAPSGAAKARLLDFV